MMHLLDYVEEYIESSGNGKWCEDKVLISQYVIGIVDGATPIDSVVIDNNQTQTCWFVNEFANGFIKQTMGAENSIDYLCEQILSQIDRSKIKDTKDYNKPSCVAAFLQLVNKTLLTISILGDCHVYVCLKDGSILHYSDNRIDAFSEATRATSLQHYKNEHERIDAIRKQRINNRKCLNQKNGYFALTLDDNWKGSFFEKRISLSCISEVLLCTDGFARLFTEYKLMSPNEFFLNRLSLVDCVGLIRNFEKKSSYNAGYVKKQDDASALLINTKLEVVK